MGRPGWVWEARRDAACEATVRRRGGGAPEAEVGPLEVRPRAQDHLAPRAHVEHAARSGECAAAHVGPPHRLQPDGRRWSMLHLRGAEVGAHAHDRRVRVDTAVAVAQGHLEAARDALHLRSGGGGAVAAALRWRSRGWRRAWKAMLWSTISLTKPHGRASEVGAG